jgi:large subunit ribosomal protein L10
VNREEKKQAVQELKERFQKASIALLADYKGLKANEINQLRRELRKQSAQLKVLKNTLAKIAVEGTELKDLKDQFQGTVAVITSEADPVGPAKVLVQFAKEFEKPQIKMGALDGKLLSLAEIVALSKLPSREELLAKMLGSMLAPAQNLVNVLSAVPRQLVTVLAAIRDKKS